MDDFNKFVHLYYDCANDEMPATVLVSKMVDCEEETFDKYFELLDEFIKQRRGFFHWIYGDGSRVHDVKINGYKEKLLTYRKIALENGDIGRRKR